MRFSFAFIGMLAFGQASIFAKAQQDGSPRVRNGVNSEFSLQSQAHRGVNSDFSLQSQARRVLEGTACTFHPKLYRKGVIPLPFNAAFLSIEDDKLLVTSFNDDNTEDTVGLIRDVSSIDFDNFDAHKDLIVLTKAKHYKRNPSDPPVLVWPNEAEFVPKGLLHGIKDEVVIIPQGFLTTPEPGRMTAVRVKDRKEFVIHECTTMDFCFYHRALFIDMDGDGLKDIVTVRSGFQPPMGPPGGGPPGAPGGPPPGIPGGGTRRELQGPPADGELVWFRNPGRHLDPNVEWEETILFHGTGPDITLIANDWDGDGIVEIVGTHFFSGSKISIYSVPEGITWNDVGVDKGVAPLVENILVNQGFPFDIVLDDLDLDGTLEIIATNHQQSECLGLPPMANPPGRVFVLKRNKQGAWSFDIVLDNFQPQPDPTPPLGFGRLAPGAPRTFRVYQHDYSARPWIVVGGDEAGKVVLLEPTGKTDFVSHVIFDINDVYGPCTTQTTTAEGTTISTIGTVAVGYNKHGIAEIYIPVFEDGSIHVYTFGDGTKYGRKRGKRGKKGRRGRKSGKRGKRKGKRGKKHRQLWYNRLKEVSCTDTGLVPCDEADSCQA